MAMRTPSTDDVLRKEAVDLATDATGFLVEHRAAVPPECAYTLAMHCVRVADRIQRAREIGVPPSASRLLGEAWLATVRAMATLDRARALADLPDAPAEALHGRLHRLALALGALAREGRD